MIAAWADISDALTANDPAVLEGESWATTVTGVVSRINVGYFWMMVNCLTSAAYVSEDTTQLCRHRSRDYEQVLSMRKRIKATGFSDWDSMFYNNLLSIPVLAFFSLIAEDWSAANLARSL